MRLLVIVGSARPVRVGDQIAREVVAIAREAGIADVDVADLHELRLPLLDEAQMAATGVYANQHTRDWSARVAGADGLLVLTPQYNFGYPAGLKNTIDFLFAEWRGKPGLLVSYGARGGTQSYELMAQVLTFVGVALDPTGVQIALPEDAYGSDGRLVDPAQVLDPYTTHLRAALARLATAMAAEAPASPAPAVPVLARAAGDQLIGAFNAHDAAAFAAAFATDGWFTDVLAHRAENRQEIEELHRFAFAGPLAHAHLEVVDSRARLLSPTAAAIELGWRSKGHRNADSEVPERRGILALVVVKNIALGSWEIASAVNNDYTHAYSLDPLGQAPREGS